MRFNSHPFLKAAETGTGGTSAPAVGGPDSAPYSRVGHVSDAKHPMDARAASVLDDRDDDLAAAAGKATATETPAKETAAAQKVSFFEKGFDPSGLDAKGQAMYKEMETALNTRLSQLPDSDTLQTLSQQSAAFQRLLQMPEFVKWAESYTGGKEEPSVGGTAAGEAANLLEGLDEDVQKGIRQLIQNTVDQEVAARVSPVADAFYAREADSTISALKQEVGADVFDRLAPSVQRIMELNEGLDVQKAFRLAHYDELVKMVAQREQKVAESKFHANMEDDGSTGTEAATRKVNSARDAVELALDMVKRGDPRAFDPLSLPPGYRSTE